MKRSIITFFIIILSLSIVGCKSISQNDQVIATVNKEKLYLNEALFYLKLTEKEFEAYGGEDIWETPFDGRTAEEVAKERAIESAIKSKILKQKAVEMNITLDEEDIKAANNQAKELITIISQDVVQDIGLTEDDVTELVKESMMGIKALYQIDVPIDDQAVNKRVDDYIKTYIENETKVSVKMLSFPTVDEKDTKLSKEDIEKAKKNAETAYNKLLEGKDTDSNYISKDIVKGMNEVYDEKIFDLNDGDIVLIETEKGYEVIKVEQFIYPDEKTVEQTRQTQKSIIEYEIEQEAFQEFYNEWKQSSKIDINQELWDTIKVKQ